MFRAMNKLALALAFSVAALLPACSATPRRLGLPRAETAELRCHVSDYSVIPLGFKRSLAFKSVDDENLLVSAFSGPPRVVEVLPGAHVIEVRYACWIDGTRGPSGEQRIELEVVGGEVLLFDLELSADGAQVSYVRNATTAQ